MATARNFEIKYDRFNAEEEFCPELLLSYQPTCQYLVGGSWALNQRCCRLITPFVYGFMLIAVLFTEFNKTDLLVVKSNFPLPGNIPAVLSSVGKDCNMNFIKTFIY
jgi:hypothetical protein